MAKKPALLDCTIRDGGYINNWNFSLAFVQRYIKVLDEAGFKYIELGFWNPNYKGLIPWLHCKESLIEQITFPDQKIKCSLMVNFVDCTEEDIPNTLAQHIDLLRIATRKTDLEAAFKFASNLINKGFNVSLNAMGMGSFTNKEIEDLASLFNKNNNSKLILYIADSYGSLMPDRTKYIFKTLKRHKDITLGFHAHNNLGLALANTLEAVNCGAELIDSSMLGMGRGGGNLRSEIICCISKSVLGLKLDPLPILSFADASFFQFNNVLKIQYDLEQVISGYADCHPKIATTLRKSQRLPLSDIYAIISEIPIAKRTHYDFKTLKEVIKKFKVKRRKANQSKYISLDTLQPKNDTKTAYLICPGINSHELTKIKNTALFDWDNTFMLNWFEKEFKPRAILFGSIRRLWQWGDQVDSQKKIIIVESELLKSLPQATLLDLSGMYQQLGQSIENSGVRAITILLFAGYKEVKVYGMKGFEHQSLANYTIEEEDNKQVETLNKEMFSELQMIKSYFSTFKKQFELINSKFN